jgi:hypothetical protein
MKLLKGENDMFEFDHVAISVSNYEKSLKFYQKLGFEEVKKVYWEERRAIIGVLRLLDTYLEIFCFEQYQTIENYAMDDLSTIGVNHFSLNTMLKLEEINLILLEKKIIEVPCYIENGDLGRRSILIKDPDGIELQIMEGKALIKKLD